MNRILKLIELQVKVLNRAWGEDHMRCGIYYKLKRFSGHSWEPIWSLEDSRLDSIYGMYSQAY